MGPLFLLVIMPWLANKVAKAAEVYCKILEPLLDIHVDCIVFFVGDFSELHVDIRLDFEHTCTRIQSIRCHVQSVLVSGRRTR
jgi:hypothetical protein